MSTRAQRRANKRNAKHSTGPRTDQGKQICAQNAIKHGLRAKHPVIPDEDPAEYQHKLESLRNDIRPVNAIEDDLVEQIADTSWRLKRLSRIEAAIERDHIEEAEGKQQNGGKDTEQIVGYAFTTHGHLDYLSRRYHRAIKELTDLRTSYEQTAFRTRAMEERDREENHWRESHSPPDQPEPTAAANEENNEQPGQSQSSATPLDTTANSAFAHLKPAEALKRIDDYLDLSDKNLGQPGPQEDKK